MYELEKKSNAMVGFVVNLSIFLARFKLHNPPTIWWLKIYPIDIPYPKK